MRRFFKRTISFVLALACMISLFTFIPDTTADAAGSIDVNIQVTQLSNSADTAGLRVTINCTGGDSAKITGYKIVISNGKETFTQNIKTTATSRSFTQRVNYFGSKYTVTVTPLKVSTALSAKDNSKNITTKAFSGNIIVITGKGSNSKGRYFTYKICTKSKQTGLYLVAYKTNSNNKYGTAYNCATAKSAKGYYVYTGTMYVSGGSGIYYLWANNSNLSLTSSNITL